LKQADKILIIRFSSLGDLILTTPFFKNLKLNFPESFVYFLTKKKFSEVFFNNPYIDRFIFLEDFNFARLIRKIKELKPDIIFDLHNNLRSFLIKMFVSGKKYTVDKRIKERRKILKKKITKIPHSRDWFLEILERKNLKVYDKKTEIFLTEEEKNKAKKLIIDIGIKTEKIIAVFPEAKWKAKTLKINKWAEIIEGIANPYTKIFLFGENKTTGENLISAIGGKYRGYIIDFTGKLTLREVFSVVNLSDIVLTPDSAPTHIANALNIPVIVFFGPTVKEFGFYPLGESDIIIEKDMDCRPCHLHGGEICKRNDFECLNIDTKEVIDIVKEKLKL